MNFIAIDFETANPDRSSICQIGIVFFKDGQIFDKFEALVNPQDYFDPFICMVHGIRRQDLVGKPTFPEFYDYLRKVLINQVVLCHTAFDRVAFSQACGKYQLEEFPITWLDNSKVVRRTWSEFARRGYGLPEIADFLNIQYKSHNACEDAKATGLVFIEACVKSGLDIQGWLDRVRKRITLRKYSAEHKFIPTVAEDGPLHGETIVITGTLPILRDVARQMAADLGAIVPDNMIDSTTMLVLGVQDKRHFHGKEKSNKHRRAEELIQKGHDIEIVYGTDFMALLKTISN
jgi:DNA polymerase-3 subunit epsilon